MTNRRAFTTGVLALGMAAATIRALPFRPALGPLPADWADSPVLPDLRVSIFPTGAVFSGDRVGVDVSMDTDPGGGILQVRLDSPAARPLAESTLFLNSLSGGWEVPLPWMWDSAGGAGWHTLFINLVGKEGAPIPAGTAPLQVPVLVLPDPRRNADWMSRTDGCCIYQFLSGTEGERDLDLLIAQTEAFYGELQAWMDGASPVLTIVFLPRLLGQGGVTTQQMEILSYMDRNYTGMDFPVVLKHEMAHLFTSASLPPGPWPPLLLVEGWAVYTTGGHYRQGESLQERAAALIQIGAFLPLENLADIFYSAQHEAAYIEAGAFVEFLADRFGRERVFAMLRDPVTAGTPATALDSMLRGHFQLTLEECESAWLDSLRLLAPAPDQVRDVEFTLRQFDAMRSYQQMYDPGGFMFTLWLPDIRRASADRISADFLPPPATAESITLQVMLRAARKAIGGREWGAAQELLASIERVLEAKQRRVPEPCSVSAPAEMYRLLVAAILRAGDEPLSMERIGNRAAVEVRDPDTLEKEVQEWDFANGNWSRAG